MPGPRRSPTPDERQRDADRTRERLLDAALTEFAAKGYAGARVADIAARAGVNKQLISYYFGGKEGAYRELYRRWLAREAEFSVADRPLADSVLHYLDEVLAGADGLRMLLWQRLASDGDDDPQLPTTDDDDLASMRARQQSGELAGDLDPGGALLAIMGMVVAPAIMPAQAAGLVGVQPGTAEFRQRYGELLRGVLQRLALSPPSNAASRTHPPAG